MKIKQIFGLLTLLAVIISFSGCKNKADNSDASSESVATIDGEGKSEFTDRNASLENEDDIVYPFVDISSEHIGEVLLGHHHDRIASKTYTDNDAVTKIVEYLGKAPMSQDGYGDKDRIYSMTYFLELKDTNGDIKYKIYFSSKYKEGYLCDFHTITSINKDGTTTGDSQFFYLDSEYLFPFIEHIETVDGREPSWLYSIPFDEAIDENNLSSVVLEYGDTVKELTDDEILYTIAIHFRSFLARPATDEDEKWQDADTLKKCTASFYDADKKLICKFVMNGYTEDDNRHQLMFYDGEDTKGVQYAVNKKAVDYFLEFAKRGFVGEF